MNSIFQFSNIKIKIQKNLRNIVLLLINLRFQRLFSSSLLFKNHSKFFFVNLFNFINFLFRQSLIVLSLFFKFMFKQILISNILFKFYYLFLKHFLLLHQFIFIQYNNFIFFLLNFNRLPPQLIHQLLIPIQKELDLFF